MIKGFGLLEVIVALAIGLGILTLVITNIGETTRISKKLISNQEKLESIFHTVEMLRSDLTKCGMRLREAARFFDFPLFENCDYSFKVTYGVGDEMLIDDSRQGDTWITVNRNDYFSKGKKILVYNPDQGIYEMNEIQGLSDNRLILLNGVQKDYPKNSVVVVLKEVEYKLYTGENVLKRKVNKGYFQPMIEKVTDFYVKFFPESCSVFYRIEVSQREQIRGYIFLTNMAEK